MITGTSYVWFFILSGCYMLDSIIGLVTFVGQKTQIILNIIFYLSSWLISSTLFLPLSFLSCFSFHNLRDLNSSNILYKGSLGVEPSPLILDEEWRLMVVSISCGSFLLRVWKQKVKETMVEIAKINTKRGVKDKVKTNW